MLLLPFFFPVIRELFYGRSAYLLDALGEAYRAANPWCSVSFVVFDFDCGISLNS